jgi:DASS family divalent anion:Na+ symporter
LNRNTWRKIIGSVLGIGCGLAVAYQSPPDSLSIQSMWGLGIITWAIINWIFDVLPEYVVAMLMCSGWVVFDVVPFKIAFEQFSNTNWWLLLSALGLGVAVSTSGLLQRMTLYVMRFFPATYKGQVLGLLITGVGIAPTIPSVTAKAAIMAPISLAMSDNMGYQHRSDGAAGLFSAMYAGFVSSCPIFVSASFMGYMVIGFLPPEYHAQFTWTYWLFCTIPWALIFLVGIYFALVLLYKPEDKETEPGFFAKQLTSLGPMSKNEKITLIVLSVTLLFWMTELVHGISSTLVAMISLCVLLGFNIYGRQDFRQKIPWDSIIFIGGIINLGSVLPYLNIDKWMGEAIGPYIIPLMSNPYLFVILLTITICLVRFVFVSMIATLTIFATLLIPFAAQAGINPWIVGFIILVSINVWIVNYQNSSYLTAYYATGGYMVKHSQVVKMSLAYILISLLGFFVCIPYWKLIGLIC